MATMTFQEAYGELPTKTWRLIKKHNVSPSDYYMMEDMLMDRAMAYDSMNWEVFNEHILMNSKSGYYIPRFF